MASLPPVLTVRDLPGPELDGMRLDGEVYRLADAWCPVDQLESPAHRAAAVRGTRSARLIAELGTAAWIWGVTDRLPPVREFCVGLDARARLRHDATVRVRELVLDADDHVRLGGAGVTSMLRTAVDLARFRPGLSDVDAASIVALGRRGGFGIPECRELLDRRRNLPKKRRALDRLAELLA